MNPQRVQLEDGTKLAAWRCGVCGLIYSEHEPYSSERCCKCQECSTVIDPKVHGARSHLCSSCWGPYYARRDAERLERATEIPDYDGPVVVGDRYYGSIDDMLESRDGDGGERPEWVHTCHVRNYTLDIDDVIENVIENANVEDSDLSPDEFHGIAELRAAVDAFNEANKGCVYWEEDSEHKVRVPPEEPNAQPPTQVTENR